MEWLVGTNEGLYEWLFYSNTPPLLRYSDAPELLHSCKSFSRPLCDFVIDQVGVALSSPDDLCFGTGNQHFRRKGSRIIIRRHGKPVSAGAHEGQKIPGFHLDKITVQREEITAFANRSNDIYFGEWLILGFPDGDHLMITLI